MKKFVVGSLAVIGALALLALFFVAGFGLLSQLAKPRVPGKTILEANFESALVEHAPETPFGDLLEDPPATLRDVVEALERASDDDRVVALVARVGAAPIGLAQLQEIRDAVLRFRESGKPAVAYAETFGEFGPGNGAYYLASAFDEIYLQPSGDIGLTGFRYESMFLRGTLDKLGVKPRMDQRHEYKNAMNSLTEKRYTPAHRQAMQSLLDSRFSQMVRGLAEARGVEEAEIRQLIDRGPFLGQESVDAGLVTGLKYRDEVYARVREQAGERARLLYLSKYLQRAGRPHQRGDTIALIYGVGAVVRGASGYDPLVGESAMGADTVSAAFRQAIDDERVKAIVFRVDSPGGSYVASDTIWRETVRAREAGKPVIVSMGELAASGGYFVSMSADKIVAQPATITGSIGVYGGKLLTAEMWGKIGLSYDGVASSRNASMWSSQTDYGPDEYRRFQAFLDRVYEDFTTKVAEGRGLERDMVLEIARGRVWTGEQALELGLVDELGGFPVAIRLAREAAGIDPEARIRLKLLPRPRSTWEQLFGEKPDSSEGRSFAALGRMVRTLRPLVRALDAATRDPGADVLRWPEADLAE